MMSLTKNDIETQIKNLQLFYTLIGIDAQKIFDERVTRWQNDPKSYIGFLGEINFAERFRQWSIRHQFLSEENIQMPDIELMINDKPIYLEIKMIRENPNIDFYLSVNDEIQTFGFGCAFLNLKIPREKKDELIKVAVQMIKEASLGANPEELIPYQVDNAEFSLKLTKVSGAGAGFWPESRKNQGIPQIEFLLKKTLKEHIKQFEFKKPTFLGWFISDSLFDDIGSHVTKVMNEFGNSEFIDVAGVIIIDSHYKWELVENRSEHYSSVEFLDLYKSLRSLSLFHKDNISINAENKHYANNV